MSIFKGTLKPFVASQLKAREFIVSNPAPRDSNFLLYTSGKNSFVRLQSFVDYDSYSYKKSEKNKLVKDSRYNKDELAKKWVLEGGTLYNNTTLRGGVANADGVYASNLDLTSIGGNKVDRPFGLRPMPGITSVDVIHKGAYGSLREATINFYCWDKHQLEELEILYMRTGYSCFLEWGWSQYLNHKDSSNINDVPDNINMIPFSGNTLNVFQGGLNDDKIYNRIDADVEKYKGNYDAMLGYIKNFSWQLMSNGGFQCSTTLISRGEAIDTIKASSNPQIILGSKPPVSTATTLQEADENKEPKEVWSFFEKIFLNIIGHTNAGEFTQRGTWQIITGSGQFYVDNISKDDKQALLKQSDEVFNDVNNRIVNSSFKVADGDFNNYKIKTVATLPSIDLKNNCVVKLIDGGTKEGNGIEYISMNSFIAILNQFFLLKNEKDSNKNIVNIVIPNNTPCLASEDSVSIDLTTCLIQNVKATFICDDSVGFDPRLYIRSGDNISSPYDFGKIPEFLQSGTNNIGAIGNIYISLSKIVDIYRNLSGSSDGVDVVILLQEVLDAISFALGGINDFKLYNQKSVIQIIDAKYFETTKSSSKFNFNLLGLKSICRDVKMNSRIYSEQSTMIAIGATSGDKNANLGDIYSSTQNYFNIGLSDRIISATQEFKNDNTSEKIKVNGVELSGKQLYYWKVYSNIESITSYIKLNVVGVKNTNANNILVAKVPQSNEVINAASLLKSFHYQINGKDVNFKSFIPFELEITLDGIAGFVVGQIFTIDKSILPKDYSNKNLGFVIMKINHSLKDNDWTTSLVTQICLLENDQIEGMYGVDKSYLKKIVEDLRVQTKKTGWLLAALTDYMIHLTLSSIYDSGGNIKGGGLEILKALSTGTIEAFVGKIASKGPTNPKLIKYLIEPYRNKNNSFPDVDTYLKNWYDYVKTVNKDEAFPKTYDDFLTTNLGGSIKKFNSTSFKNLTFNPTIPNNSVMKMGLGIEDKPLSTCFASDFKAVWDSIFIGKVINEFRGLDITLNEEVDKSLSLEDNTIQQITDGGKLVSKTYKKIPRGSLVIPYGASVSLYANLKPDALIGMYTKFFIYLKTHQNDLDLQGFDPSTDPKTDNYEKVTK